MLTGSITLLIVIAWGGWILTGERLFKESRSKVMFSMFFVFYISQLLAATLFPLPIEPALIEREQMRSAAGFGQENNFTLFQTLRDASASETTFFNQIVGNFLLLVPLGFLAPFLWDRYKSVRNALGLVLATTFAIEFSQLAISGILGFTYRSFDVDDLWLNALGGFYAVAAALAVQKLTQLRTAPSRLAAIEERVEHATTGSRETALCRSAP